MDLVAVLRGLRKSRSESKLGLGERFGLGRRSKAGGRLEEETIFF